jgi:hypothetical protein
MLVVVVVKSIRLRRNDLLDDRVHVLGADARLELILAEFAPFPPRC